MLWCAIRKTHAADIHVMQGLEILVAHRLQCRALNLLQDAGTASATAFLQPLQPHLYLGVHADLASASRARCWARAWRISSQIVAGLPFTNRSGSYAALQWKSLRFEAKASSFSNLRDDSHLLHIFGRKGLVFKFV